MGKSPLSVRARKAPTGQPMGATLGRGLRARPLLRGQCERWRGAPLALDGNASGSASALLHRDSVDRAEDLEHIALGLTPVAIPGLLLEQPEACYESAVESLLVSEARRAVLGAQRVVVRQRVPHAPVAHRLTVAREHSTDGFLVVRESPLSGGERDGAAVRAGALKARCGSAVGLLLGPAHSLALAACARQFLKSVQEPVRVVLDRQLRVLPSLCVRA